MDTLCTFWDNITHYKTESVHFLGLLLHLKYRKSPEHPRVQRFLLIVEPSTEATTPQEHGGKLSVQDDCVGVRWSCEHSERVMERVVYGFFRTSSRHTCIILCIYIYICVCVHMLTLTYIFLHMHVYIYIYTHTLCVHIYIYTYTLQLICVYIHTHMHTHLYVDMSMYTCYGLLCYVVPCNAR